VLLAPFPNPKLESHPLSYVCNWLFIIFAATLHIGGCSSFYNMRMCHAVVTALVVTSKEIGLDVNADNTKYMFPFRMQEGITI